MKNFVSLRVLCGFTVLAGAFVFAAPAMAQQQYRGTQNNSLWHPTYNNYGFTRSRSNQSYRTPVIYSRPLLSRTFSLPVSYSAPTSYPAQSAPVIYSNTTSPAPLYQYAAPSVTSSPTNSSACGGCGCGCGKSGSCGCGN